MKIPVTLVIPTHNRHHYLTRLLDYYQQADFNIIIADSSPEKYKDETSHSELQYLHLPARTMTEKLSEAFNLVSTPFIVMCADDDFAIPDGISNCVDFLMANDDYAAAAGNIMCYQRNEVGGKPVTFATMYTNYSAYEIADPDPFDRLRNHFKNYKAVFYSVHRTSNLKKAFNAASGKVNNLFLNEYLTSVIPIISGKYKDLPVLFQVREFSPVSGDKTQLNIDTIISDLTYRAEYLDFVDCQATVIASITGKNTAYCSEFLNNVFSDFARDLPAVRNHVDNSLKKRVGNIIRKIPFIGGVIIRLSRNNERLKKVEMMVKTKRDKENIVQIENKILRYA